MIRIDRCQLTVTVYSTGEYMARGYGKSMGSVVEELLYHHIKRNKYWWLCSCLVNHVIVLAWGQNNAEMVWTGWEDEWKAINKRWTRWCSRRTVLCSWRAEVSAYLMGKRREYICTDVFVCIKEKDIQKSRKHSKTIWRNNFEAVQFTCTMRYQGDMKIVQSSNHVAVHFLSWMKQQIN